MKSRRQVLKPPFYKTNKMQLNIDFNINKIHYLQMEIVKLQSELNKTKNSNRSYKGWSSKRKINKVK